MVSTDPHVYLFNGPFVVTFAPFFNPPYYYAGYRHLFKLKAQIRAIGGNGLRLMRVLGLQLELYALIVCWLILRRRDYGPRTSPRSLVTLWPLLLVSWLGSRCICWCLSRGGMWPRFWPC